MGARKILVVEDRASLRRLFERALSAAGYAVTTAVDGADGIARLSDESFDLVLTDLKMPGASGLDVVAECRRQGETPILVLTAYGTVATAVEAMKRGATDFLEKPVDLDDLEAMVRDLLREREVESPELLEIPGAPPLVGRHRDFRAALRLLRKVAPTDSTVLLSGETGTGKELFARALHALSPRKDGPFVAVNCAAIPESLLESELFGHEKGAFTGAGRLQRGRFELADGGTLFLDEIGELDPAAQGKTLRVLEERVLERIGGGRPIVLDVRVVAATNRDLQAMVEEGSFRRDLFFRLDVFPIALPPLRERASDIALLASHLLVRIAERVGVAAPRLDADAVALLEAQPWPGNVRQLANVLERAAILADGILGAAELETMLHSASRGQTAADQAAADQAAADQTAETSEHDLLRAALRAAQGDKRRAAEALGMSLRTLQRKVRRHDLEGVEYR